MNRNNNPYPHIVIVRTGASVMNLNSYNSQELGLAKALVKRGLKVSIILAGKEETHTEINYSGYAISVYYVRFIAVNQAISWFFRLNRFLEELKPTIVQIHEFGMFMSLRVLLWARKRNIKTVLIQGSYQMTHKPVFRQMELVYNLTFGKYLLNHVDNIGCKSLMASRYIHEYSKANTMNAFIGLDIDKFENEMHCNKVCKSELADKKILLYIGSIEKRRNPLFLAEIIKRLPQEYVLLVVGDGPLYTELKDYTIRHNIEDRIKLLGKLKQEELPSLYRMAQLFLLASDYEIYGMVILESMYYGCPVLSTLTAGSEVLINNEADGIIIEGTPNVTKWVDKIQKLFSDPIVLENMRKKAMYKIKTQFIWDRACENFIRVYGLLP